MPIRLKGGKLTNSEEAVECIVKLAEVTGDTSYCDKARQVYADVKSNIIDPFYVDDIREAVELCESKIDYINDQ